MPEHMYEPMHMTCAICHSSHIRFRFSVAGYRVFGCLACGFQFVAPTPSERELAEYASQVYAVPLERYAGHTARNDSRIAELERWLPGRGRLLEVGASYGHSLALARARGWQVAGVELSRAAAAYAREHFQLEVHPCDLLDAPLTSGSFDAAISWHVLEHTREPRAQLARMLDLLRPGGVLGLRVPNVASFGARVAGRAWPWMCPPAHLWFFSPSTLPRLLHECGFEMLEVATRRGDGNNIYQHTLIAIGGRLNGLRRQLARLRRPHSQISAHQLELSLIADRPSPATAHPPALLRAWVGLLARAQPATDALERASRPLSALLERAGLGDELVCYARRPEKRP
jgi:SAM-dependent methyltransferase